MEFVVNNIDADAVRTHVTPLVIEVVPTRLVIPRSPLHLRMVVNHVFLLQDLLRPSTA